MLTNIGNKTLGILHHLIPLLSALIFIFISVLTWPIPYWGQVAPSLGLAAVFYWSVYRPDLFRPMTVFGIGLIFDILHGSPLGLTACVFLIIHQMSYSYRRFFVGQVFYMLWFGFASVALLSMAITWLVTSFYNGKIIPLWPVFIQTMMSIAFFPLPAWILIKLQRAFLSREST